MDRADYVAHVLKPACEGTFFQRLGTEWDIVNCFATVPIYALMDKLAIIWNWKCAIREDPFDDPIK